MRARLAQSGSAKPKQALAKPDTALLNPAQLDPSEPELR